MGRRSREKSERRREATVDWRVEQDRRVRLVRELAQIVTEATRWKRTIHAHAKTLEHQLCAQSLRDIRSRRRRQHHMLHVRACVRGGKERDEPRGS